MSRLRHPAAIFLSAAFLLLLSCGRADFSSGKAELGRGLRVAVPPIADGERASYQVLIAGTPAGTRSVEVRHGLHSETTPVFILAVVDFTRTSVVQRFDSAVVYVTRDSLKPIAAFHFSRVAQAMTTTAALYRPGSVGVSTFSPQGGERRVPIPTGPNTFDADELTLLGRAVQVPANGSVEFMVVEPMSRPAGGRIAAAKFTPGPDEQISVPAGVFDCSRLDLELGGATVSMWYEKSVTRRLVRYESSSGQVLELLP